MTTAPATTVKITIASVQNPIQINLPASVCIVCRITFRGGNQKGKWGAKRLIVLG
jgi:hypothetical protein